MKTYATFFSLLMAWSYPVISNAQSNSPCASGSVAAPALTVGSSCTITNGTTVGATQQTNNNNGGAPSCGSMGPDVWYRFTAPSTGAVTITTQAGSITDGVMAVYSGSCGSWTELACSDDGNGTMPEITLTSLTPGTTYLIRFWQYGGGTGTFGICVKSITPTVASNTTCATPSPVCSGSPITFVANAGGSAASAMNPGNDYACLSTSPNPSWYYLEIAQAGDLIIDITAGSDVDYEIWGPYTNVSNAIATCNSHGAPKDCSYSSSNIEQAVVNNVAVGQVYVLLVTNYANVVQTIHINEAATNTASTNCAIVPLPVGYSQWDVQFTGKEVRLYWTTESEQNNAYFAVQRSADGLIWETIGMVNGNGNSSQIHAYSFTDNTPEEGLNYYRLMQVDTDGNMHFTDIKSVNTTRIDHLTVYPNPAGHSFRLVTDSKEVESVILTDLIGHNYEIPYTASGNELKFDCEALASGVYTLTLVSEGLVQSERIVIKK